MRGGPRKRIPHVASLMRATLRARKNPREIGPNSLELDRELAQNRAELTNFASRGSCEEGERRHSLAPSQAARLWRDRGYPRPIRFAPTESGKRLIPAYGVTGNEPAERRALSYVSCVARARETPAA